MRVLFAVPYSPGTTRVRSRKLLEQLCTRNEVTILSLVWGEDDIHTLGRWVGVAERVCGVSHGQRQVIRALPGDLQRPLQQIASTSPAFARAARRLVQRANWEGRPFDVIHVEHFRAASAIDLLQPLGAPVVFDAVDCIAELARLTRQHGPNIAARTIARYEEQRSRAIERAWVETANTVTVVAERDRIALSDGAFHPEIFVIPNGADVDPRPVALTSSPHAVFTGKLSYHANQAAIRWLLEEVWPLVRRAVPDARLTIAGAQPPGWMRRASGQAGVRVVGDPADLISIIRSARVALCPMRYSVGIQNKALEAMACGVPVVATPTAAEGLGPRANGAFALAGDRQGFVSACVELLTDDNQATSLGVAGYDYVARHHSWLDAARSFEDLYQAQTTIRRVA